MCIFYVKDVIVSWVLRVLNCIYTKSTIIRQDNGSLKCFNYHQQLQNGFFHDTYSVMELNQLKPGYWITNFRLIFYANDKFEYKSCTETEYRSVHVHSLKINFPIEKGPEDYMRF